MFLAFLLYIYMFVNDIYFILVSNKKKIFTTFSMAKRNLRLTKQTNILTASAVDLHDNKLS